MNAVHIVAQYKQIESIEMKQNNGATAILVE